MKALTDSFGLSAVSAIQEHAEPVPSLEQIYTEHFDFVWRNARRLNVPESAADDVVQDVFIVVHRRLADFRGGPMRPWIFGILTRVVSLYRRTHQRKAGRWLPLDTETVSEPTQSSPSELAERAERMRLLAMLLEELSEEQKTLILLADLEQWKLRELAEYFGTTISTIYSRLFAARARFEKAYTRAMAKRRGP